MCFVVQSQKNDTDNRNETDTTKFTVKSPNIFQFLNLFVHLFSTPTIFNVNFQNLQRETDNRKLGKNPENLGNLPLI